MKFRCPYVAFMLLLHLLVISQFCLAEGSKDLYPAGATGNRAFLTSSNTATSPLIGNIYNRGRVYTYLNPGERIYLGSSAQGIGGGTIILIAPNGNTYTTGSSTTTGLIQNRAQELFGPTFSAPGGYNAYSRLVTASEAGVWTIEFVSSNPSATAIGNPFTSMLADANWTSADQIAVQNFPLIIAWDITIKNVLGNVVTGRTYQNVFTANTGGLPDSFTDSLMY